MMRGPALSYEEFLRQILKVDGVTMVGPKHSIVVGVEDDAAAVRLRRMIAPHIPVIVTGPLVKAAAPKHPGVATYEAVAASTKPT
jgi:hypothetical protein